MDKTIFAANGATIKIPKHAKEVQAQKMRNGVSMVFKGCV